MKAAKQPYQLFSTVPLPKKTYVAVNGPWDKYGVVTSSKRLPDGRYLNQIRGVDPRPLETPKYQF